MKNTKASKLLTFGLFFLSFVLATFILTAQKASLPAEKEFVIDEPAPRTVFSPIHVTFSLDEETERLRKEKEAGIAPIVNLDPQARPALLGRAGEAWRGFVQSEEAAGRVLGTGVSEEVLQALTLTAESLLQKGVMKDGRKKEFAEAKKARLRIFDLGTKEGREVKLDEVMTLTEAREKAAALLAKEVKDRRLQAEAIQILSEALQTNLAFDEAATKESLKVARESVAPVVEEVKRGELVVQRGLLVTAEERERLIQIQKKIAKKEAQSRFFASVIFVFLALALVFFYLQRLEPKAGLTPRFLAFVLTALGITLASEKITLLIPESSVYLFPGSLAALLLTILWNPGLGLLGVFAGLSLSVPLTEFRADLLLMLLMGSLAGVFSSRGIRKRIHFLRIGSGVGLVNALVLLGFSLFQGRPFAEALPFSVLGIANGFLTTALSFFLIPVFEYVFNLTTDVTLLELSDLNHPLLKRMVVEAPGTYHHSLVMSTLAEAACEAIGARALLARVGCYFHDIGKIARSEYFTENQTPETCEKHEKLTATMSSLIVMSHVKEGMELAKKHKLKDVIVRFIPEHHGTGVVYYFYRKALDHAQPGEKVSADDFRYAGPKPQSRETAVALLADSTEAASRSLKDITPAGIRSLVRKIINEKFIDGQLDECDLTLKDLHKIQGSFVHNLMAIFHTRVSYPAKPLDPSRPDLFREDEFTKFR